MDFVTKSRMHLPCLASRKPLMFVWQSRNRCQPAWRKTQDFLKTKFLCSKWWVRSTWPERCFLSYFLNSSFTEVLDHNNHLPVHKTFSPSCLEGEAWCHPGFQWLCKTLLISCVWMQVNPTSVCELRYHCIMAGVIRLFGTWVMQVLPTWQRYHYLMADSGS